MNYAVIKTGGKQYKVTQGDVITVERLVGTPDETITFSEVLMTLTDGQAQFGQPLVEGLVVTGKLVEHLRGEKIRVAKFKAKARYRRVTGHRQELSKVEIEAIGGVKKAEKKVVAPKEVKVVSPTKSVVKKTTRKIDKK